MSQLPIPEFITQATQVTLEDRCSRHAALKERLATDASYPTYWREAADRYLAAFHRSASRLEFYLPVEFKGHGPIDVAFGAVQEYVGEFADLLNRWPEILFEIRE
jgi:hypothetical protein